MDLLVGATGTVGRHVLARYRGQPVRVFVRSEKSGMFVKETGIGHAFRGNDEKPDSLKAAFDGIDRLFLLTPATLDQPQVERRFLEAARDAGVKRIVYVSLQYTGAKPNIKITSLHELAEEWLAQSKISYTALRPPSFMDNLLWQLDLIKQGQIVYAGVGDGRIAHIDTRDIADVAYGAMSDESLQGPVDITSAKAVTFGEIAEELSRQLGYTVTLIEPPASEWRKGLLQNGMPEWYADALIEGMAYYARQSPIVASEAVKKFRPLGPRTLEDFISEKIVPLAKRQNGTTGQ